MGEEGAVPALAGLIGVEGPLAALGELGGEIEGFDDEGAGGFEGVALVVGGGDVDFETFVAGLVAVEVRAAGEFAEAQAVGGEELGETIIGDTTYKYGLGGVIHAAAVIFFAYLGFEAVSTAGAEAKNPGKDMPIGILGALTICTILYILTCAVLGTRPTVVDQIAGMPTETRSIWILLGGGIIVSLILGAIGFLTARK